MAPKPLTYRTRDLVQALHGAKLVGLKVRRLEIDKDGKITVDMCGPAPDADDDDKGNEEWQAKLDEWEEKAQSEREPERAAKRAKYRETKGE